MWTLPAIVDLAMQAAAGKPLPVMLLMQQQLPPQQQQHLDAVVAYVFVVAVMPQLPLAAMMSPQNAAAPRICDSLPHACCVTFAH